MKKILIVNKSFDLGGIQSSMVNMANELSKYYEVHLFIYNPSGVLKERLNKAVTIIEPSWRFNCLGMSFKGVLKTNNPKMIFFRLFATVWSKLFNNSLPINVAIKHQHKLIDYDLAIAYHHERRKKSVCSGFVRVVDKCVDAKKKMAWLHFDCNTIDLDSKYNNTFYQTMDIVTCVSKSLMENFAKKHPSLSDKLSFCYNFVPYEEIKEKSLKVQEIAYSNEKFICFSACRLTSEKALVRGILALVPILKQYKDIMWFIAGDGPERNNIDRVISENELGEQVILIGTQTNPYPYMKNAHLILNVSYHEAAPMVFFESKALGTPVFATRTSSTEELLVDKIDSFICDNSDEGIRKSFAWLMKNREFIKTAKINLEKYSANNRGSLEKVCSVIE